LKTLQSRIGTKESTQAQGWLRTRLLGLTREARSRRVRSCIVSIMDESREEIPRISVDSLREWHGIKANFTKAVLEQFDQRIRQSGLESERATLLSHTQRVRFDSLSSLVDISSHSTVLVYRHDF